MVILKERSLIARYSCYIVREDRVSAISFMDDRDDRKPAISAISFADDRISFADDILLYLISYLFD